MQLNITVLPGDGIGPEVTSEALRVLNAVAGKFEHQVRVNQKLIGGSAVVRTGNPLPDDTVQTCLSSNAVLLGAVGDPSFDRLPVDLRPERGLLRLRQALGAFANLRPATCFAPLLQSSPLREEIVRGTDILIVRELLGGLYFGEPRSTSGSAPNRSAIDTMHYREPYIERIATVAFKLAQARSRRVTSVDKANVLDCSRLWRDVVTRIGKHYPDIELHHMYVDSAAMALVSRPSQFDVLLTENMFGDILSDQAGAVVGSIGIFPSASLGGPVGFYATVHGSAPDIAGKGTANPIGAILSIAMMFRHSFELEEEAVTVESAVLAVLNKGYRTEDISTVGRFPIQCAEMGRRIAESISHAEIRTGQLT
jgi:3-isopropylmalate dehydrogenase